MIKKVLGVLLKGITAVVRFVNNVNDWLGRIVSYLALAIIAVITFEVVARYVFNAPTTWAVETGTYIFAVMWLFAGGYVMRHNSHVRVDILYNRLSTRGKAIMDIVTAPFFFIMISLLIWITLKYAKLSIAELERSSSQWAPYVFPIKTLIPIGATILIIQGIAKLISNIYTAIKGTELT